MIQLKLLHTYINQLLESSTLILLLYFFSGASSHKAAKSKDRVVKSRSPTGVTSGSSSRFTVSPADDPHLVWRSNAPQTPGQKLPPWSEWVAPLSSVTMTTPGGYFFYYEKKKGLPFQKAACSPGFTNCRRGESMPQ